MKKAIICLSGGLDSSVCFLWSLKKYAEVKAVFFNYGQKAYDPEKRTVLNLCKQNNIEFLEIDLKFLGRVSGSSLNKIHKEIPTESVDIHNIEASQKSAESVWVPNRNGLFINVAAAMAESLKFEDVVVGFNAEEAKTFPDNSKEFIEEINKTLAYSTKTKVRVVSPTLDLDKIEILKLGLTLGLKTEEVWPCYSSEEKLCGKCESCKRFNRAKKGCGL